MRYLDYGVIVLYLIGITLFGARFKQSQSSLKDYFLGGKSAPWWAIGFSIVSAETSTLTVIGTPSLSFAGNFGFLQVVFGYLFARLLIVAIFLPAYFRGELYTAYELMDRRFGPNIRKLTAGLFLILRALAEGVRVFAISIVITIILGNLLERFAGPGMVKIASIVLIVCLTLFYTFEGGMTAVIWTDVVQMFVYIAGAIISLFVILGKIDGGWDHVSQVAGGAGKFQIFDFGFSPTAKFFSTTYNFWAGLIGGCFLTTASHGTEQLMVQRLLAAKDQRESRLALLSSWFVILFQFSLFLVIGACLFVYYRDHGLASPKVPNEIYPRFIWDQLPPGIAGLVIAAILAAAMSNLSAALNSLASTTVMDFLKPYAKVKREESHYLRVAKIATLIWGGVLFAIAIVAQNWGNVLEAGLSIASILYGALLGVFLLGLLNRTIGERAAMAGMTASVLSMLYIKFATPIAWTWYVVIGTAITIGVAVVASWFVPEKAAALEKAA